MFSFRLGDRHAENILFDEINGDCVHVDLNMLFDLGLGLAVPEVVPFRLTNNLIDAMGVLGYKGLFTTTCEQTMDVLLRNKDALMSVFQTLGTCWSLEGNVRLGYLFKKLISGTNNNNRNLKTLV